MGAILIIFSILAFTQTGGLPDKSALFPKLILYAMGITGVLMILDAVIKRKKAEKDSELTLGTFIFQIAIPGAVLLITYMLILVFGYYIASFFLVSVVFFYQTNRANNIKMSGRHFVKGIIVAAIIIAIMYFIFTVLLGLPVPKGSFFS